ncbi:MAG: Eco29kI family restriction endonuclease [Deltaproteobacteria bacterium]|nr:Eco29kI family restriction endonuclease [Deltaproteobacteria bacterium]
MPEARDFREYNPLDYENLTWTLVRELLTRGPFDLPLMEPFVGSGVYALFYDGDFGPYRTLRSADASTPIYAGKAVPAGSRKGNSKNFDGKALFKRIGEHVASINAAENLDIAHFRCRFLVVTPLWITMAERFLIEHFRPVWNQCIDGFGNHTPGIRRGEGEISWWDALHPGRPWARGLRRTRSETDAQRRLQSFLGVNRASDGEPA